MNAQRWLTSSSERIRTKYPLVNDTEIVNTIKIYGSWTKVVEFKEHLTRRLSEAEAESVKINLHSIGFDFTQPTPTGFV